MPINWIQLKNKISDYLLDTANATSMDKTAEFISNEYVNAVKYGGVDLFGNKITSIDVEPLKNTLSAAFKLDSKLKITGKLSVNTLGISGIVSTWSGGLLETKNPPPTGTIPVSNTVSFPGVPFEMDVTPSSDKSRVSLAEEIVKSLIKHSKTVTGINLWTTPAGVPVPGTWTGIS
jgi:hypothetical protein